MSIVLQCVKCYGNLINYTPGATTCECPYCGSIQTLPKISTDKKNELLQKASRLRQRNEFDKAMRIYDQILEEDESDSDIYWKKVLCRYGIEYLNDPLTGERLANVRRTQNTPVKEDEDYLHALDYAKENQRTCLQKDAEEIDAILKKILEISKKERPFDVFICYKESDENKERTQDSVLGYDLYKELSNEGLRVFFARVTLESVLGQDYEPYIFAALNSAKAMIVIGSRPEYFNAFWVKNEWIRYLYLQKNDSKRLIIPVYEDIDDVPFELKSAQGMDVNKIGFKQELVHRLTTTIKMQKEEGYTSANTIAQPLPKYDKNVFLKRGKMALEDHEWEEADRFYEDVLNHDESEASAYLGKYFAKLNVASLEEVPSYYLNKEIKYERKEAFVTDLSYVEKAVKEYTVRGFLNEDQIRTVLAFNRTFDSELSFRQTHKQEVLDELNGDRFLSRARQFAEGEIKISIEDMISEMERQLDEKISEAEKYDKEKAESKKTAFEVHKTEALERVKSLYEQAIKDREDKYVELVKMLKKAKSDVALSELQSAFLGMYGYKRSDGFAKMCEKKRTRKKARKIAIVLGIIASPVIIIILFILSLTLFIPGFKYTSGKMLLKKGEYGKALTNFQEVENYWDSKTYIKECAYCQAVQDMEDGNYENAKDLFNSLGLYKDSSGKYNECIVAINQPEYDKAMNLKNNEEYLLAINIFKSLDGWSDSSYQVEDCQNLYNARQFETATQLFTDGNIAGSYRIFSDLGDYETSSDMVSAIAKSYKDIVYKNAEIGDIVSFGNYNGNTEWIVVDKEAGKLQLLSRFVVEQRIYDEIDLSTDWEYSSLKDWLNTTYKKAAFNAEEQKMILDYDIRYDNGDVYTNQIYIIAVKGAENFFSSDKERKATLLDGTPSYYWLRSGFHVDDVPFVDANGKIDSYGDSYWDHQYGVRPTLWLDISNIPD